MQEYLPQEIETKWQNYWEEQGLLDFDFASEKPKYYMLTMLPISFGGSAHWSLVCDGSFRQLCAFYENAGQRGFFSYWF